MQLRDSTDLVRTLLSFNGLTNGDRTVRAMSDDSETYRGEGHLKMTQKGNTLTITVPHLALSCNPEDLDAARQGVYERVANFLNSGNMLGDLASRGLIKDEGEPSPLAMITEAFEGVRAARKFGGEWRGTREGLAKREASRVAALGKHAASADDKTAGYIASEALAGSLMADWSPELYKQEAMLEDAASPVLKNKLTKLRDSGIISELDKAQSYEEVRELANRAFEMLYERTAAEEEQQCQQDKGHPGDGEEEGEGSGMGELADDTGRGKGSAGGDGSEGDGEASKAKGKSRGEPTPPTDSFAIGADGTGSYVPTPDDCVHFIDFTKTPGRAESWSARNRPSVLGNTTGLANAVRQAIQVKAQAYYVGAQRKGKIQRSNVYRIGVPTVGSGEWNARFRKRKVEANTLDTAVLLLVDYSGSMSGSKISMAMGCALAMSDVLNSLNVKYAIHGFTTGEGVPDIADYNGYHAHLIFKGFRTPLNKVALSRTMSKATRCLANNEDYKALDVGVRALLAEKASRHVMIVLSDGNPACHRPGNQGAAMKEFVRQNSKHVEFVGIGIEDDSVKRYYPNHTIIRSASELPAVILSTIKAKLT